MSATNLVLARATAEDIAALSAIRQGKSMSKSACDILRIKGWIVSDAEEPLISVTGRVLLDAIDARSMLEELR